MAKRRHDLPKGLVDRPKGAQWGVRSPNQQTFREAWRLAMARDPKPKKNDTASRD